MSLKSTLTLCSMSLRHINISRKTIFLNRHIITAYDCCKQVRSYSYESTAKPPISDKIRIYTGQIAQNIKLVKGFSLSTSLIGIVAQPLIYKELIALQNIPLLVTGYTFIGFFTIVTPLLLHFITKKYVIHLDYKPATQSYVATTLNLFCLRKETEFKPEDVHVPDVPGMFTTLHAKGVPLFMEARLFEDPSHYAKIMGYDKPIDFKLYENAIKEAKK